jgi:hypothetical protein
METPSRSRKPLVAKLYRLSSEPKREEKTETFNHVFDLREWNENVKDKSRSNPKNTFLSCYFLYDKEPWRFDPQRNRVFLEDSFYGVFKGGQYITGEEPDASAPIPLDGWYGFCLQFLPSLSHEKERSPARLTRAVPFRDDAESPSSSSSALIPDDPDPDWNIDREDVSDEDLDKFLNGITLEEFDTSLSPNEVADRLGIEDHLTTLAREEGTEPLLLYAATATGDLFFADDFYLTVYLGGDRLLRIHEPSRY